MTIIRNHANSFKISPVDCRQSKAIALRVPEIAQRLVVRRHDAVAAGGAREIVAERVGQLIARPKGLHTSTPGENAEKRMSELLMQNEGDRACVHLFASQRVGVAISEVASEEVVHAARQHLHDKQHTTSTTKNKQQIQTTAHTPYNTNK